MTWYRQPRLGITGVVPAIILVALGLSGVVVAMERTVGWPGPTVPGGLDVAWRSALLQLGMDRHYKRGDVLLGQREVGTCIIVLRSGQARVVASTEDGERVVVGVRVAGEIVGEMSFVDRAPRRASVVASGPVLGTTIDNHTLSDFILRYPETMVELAWSLARKLRSAEMRQLVAHDAATRILYALADVVARISAADHETRSSRQVDVLLTQRELGQLALVAEVSVQRALRKLARRGLVETAYGRVIIRNPDAVLAEAAKGPKSIIHAKHLLLPAG
jgi:CRP/FNR family transcriptional regulator, cyclic AMP receptor protein